MIEINDGIAQKLSELVINSYILKQLEEQQQEFCDAQRSQIIRARRNKNADLIEFLYNDAANIQSILTKRYPNPRMKELEAQANGKS